VPAAGIAPAASRRGAAEHHTMSEYKRRVRQTVTRLSATSRTNHSRKAIARIAREQSHEPDFADGSAAEKAAV